MAHEEESEEPVLYELTDLVRRGIEEGFASLSWSRVLSRSAEAEVERREWPMVEDILEVREQIMEHSEANVADPPILFDPKAFEGDHGDIRIDDYELSEAELLRWAQRTTDIRRSLQRRRDDYQQDLEGQREESGNLRTR